jgi:hypothetical protein
MSVPLARNTKSTFFLFSCFSQMMKQDRQLDSSILEASQIFPHSFLVEFTTVVLLHFTSEASIAIHIACAQLEIKRFFSSKHCVIDYLSVYLLFLAPKTDRDQDHTMHRKTASLQIMF